MNFSRGNDNNRVATNNESSEERLSTHEMERREEEKLKAKYPILKSSNIKNIMVMKYLHKGQKYFDSGDYQMAKQKGHDVSQVFPYIVTGDIIPTIETLRVRKSSTIQGKCSVTQCNKPETPIADLLIIPVFRGQVFVTIQCFSCQYLLNHPQDYLHLRFHDAKYNNEEKKSEATAKYSFALRGSATIVFCPGFQFAGQTSPCSSVNWNACTKRNVSSTLRPTVISLISRAIFIDLSASNGMSISPKPPWRRGVLTQAKYLRQK
uniref:Uncharacterized protein n=1 Tax=Glossina pallidipes TaxID=7398 RepID=A0A1A9Z1M2_GLOPL